MSREKYAILDRRLDTLNRLRPLNPALRRLVQDQLVLRWTYHSSAIEGNTLTYEETSFYLLRGLTAKGKPLEEHLELSNHRDAVTFLETIVAQGRSTVTERLIREIHAILFRNISTIRVGMPGRETTIPLEAGAYKQQDNHVLKADGSVHYYTPAVAVAAEMRALIDWYRLQPPDTHPLECAVKVHYELVRIHPFADGNGRVARLVMNLILMQHGFPPVVVRQEHRERYYDTLERADQGDLRSFVTFIRDEAINTIDLILDVVHGTAPAEKSRHRLYALRKQAGLTQQDLAGRTGIGQAVISRIENRRERPNEHTLRRLAKGLRTSINALRESDL